MKALVSYTRKSGLCLEIRNRLKQRSDAVRFVLRELTLTKCLGRWIGGCKPEDSNLRLARDDGFRTV